MILKPGDLVLFKSELTPQIKNKLEEWFISISTFNKYRSTCQIVREVFDRFPGEETIKIKNSSIYWPIQLFEEDNEF